MALTHNHTTRSLRRSVRRLAVTIAATLAVGIATTTGATAEDVEPGAVGSAVGGSATNLTVKVGDLMPVDEEGNPVPCTDPAVCSTTTAVSMQASAESVATAEMLAADGDLTSQNGVTLAEAATAACTIWTRTWWQELRGLYYYNWWEKHDGRIYYNKSCGQVWSTTSTYGRKGYHRCDLGGGFGYDVVVKHCVTERRYDLSGRPISETDRFQVAVIWKGLPFRVSKGMHINAHASGTVRFYVP